MRDFNVPGSTAIAQHSCSSEICLCEKHIQRLADSSAEFYRRCERRESCQGHQKCKFKLICVRSRTVTSIDTLFMDALVFSVRVMTLILYLTAWPHRLHSLYFVVKDWSKKHVTNEIQASHMGDYQSSVAPQNISDVTASEMLLASKLQIFRQTLPNDDFQQYCVSTNLMVHTFVDTETLQKPM